MKIGNTIEHTGYSTKQSAWQRGFVLIPLALIWLALSPQARAVCQEGCDLTNSNTFLGDDALVNNTTGSANTAIGAEALTSNTTGFYNTAIGFEALKFNTTGTQNTAIGIETLLYNTSGTYNTAIHVDSRTR